jgi:hypothetical protein|tara:strand:+ start:281 stop:511 length:231 start_codon:yes stop_codon:yes gene_type:complete
MRLLKGTDWIKANNMSGYYKCIGNKKFYIRRDYYWSASSKKYEKRYLTYFSTEFQLAFVGYRETFKESMKLVEGGK